MRYINLKIIVALLVLIGLWIGKEAVMNADAKNLDTNLTKATFAGGCFWCMEPPFEKLPGVKAVLSGYTGGEKDNPTYHEVAAGVTGHAEVIQIHYDAKQVSYEKLLEVFWQQIDPTDAGGQFVDRGKQYRSAIFYHDETQKKLAAASKQALANSGRFKETIVTEIIPLKKFYPAEDYHQDYYKKNPLRYKFYRHNSGRDQFLNKVWKQSMEKKQSKYSKLSEAELQKQLTPTQYKVTQQEGTEPAFNNQYWDNKREGIYVDIVSGEPLFSSTDKFKSGTGWPSFTKPIKSEHVIEKQDRKLFTSRTEVRSKHGDSHLGHVFPDGPNPTGMRYCINSASLRFIPKEDLAKGGYEEYLKLFQ